MSSSEKCVRGCRFESWGRCLSEKENPSESIKGKLVPVGEIEGQGLVTADGLACLAAANLLKQENCSSFEQRTLDDDERDGIV